MSTLCETYGLDAETRAERVAWAGLSRHDRSTAAWLQDWIIRPRLGKIVDDFYDALGNLPAFWQVIREGNFAVGDLKRSQTQYLLTLGTDFDTEAYFEARLRVGLAHVQAGVTLSLYHAAFGIMQRLLVDRIQRLSLASDARARLIRFVLKITSLDQSLATEVYHLARVQSLSESLEATRTTAQELRTRAARDSLTGLTNREFILTALDNAMAESTERGATVSVIMADLDHFKDVNDTFGHLVGDEVLQHVTARMVSAVRLTEVVGRYGGEEFLLVLRDTDVDSARQVAERIRCRIHDEPIKTSVGPISISLSQGIAEGQPGESPRDLIARADGALYLAKEGGRNRIEITTASSQGKAG